MGNHKSITVSKSSSKSNDACLYETHKSTNQSNDMLSMQKNEKVVNRFLNMDCRGSEVASSLS